ncbi:Self-incompatibility protein [Parasponia andersonii]|uniref:S-protein homolog n=1 Tax=Parasponia andersonii TaxID=3476 RepID=A0A2P5DHJ6_PARAD|nr:Self-incompatibility protein [Parasponia andersonii]
MSHRLLLVLPFFFVFFSSLSEICEGQGTYVVITNGLGPNIDLTLHCYFKEKDLGVQVLHYNETFGFRFKPNVLDTKLLFCSFQWGQSDLHSFDIYKTEDKCLYCQWSITTAGPCFFNQDTSLYDICYQWK